MSDSTSKKAAPQTQEPASFEVAMERLEELVSDMENADLPLDQIVERYEEGVRLKKFCLRKLAAAEERVKKISPDADGNPEESPLDPSGEVEETNDTAPAPRRKKPTKSGEDSFLL